MLLSCANTSWSNLFISYLGNQLVFIFSEAFYSSYQFSLLLIFRIGAKIVNVQNKLWLFQIQFVVLLMRHSSFDLTVYYYNTYSL